MAIPLQPAAIMMTWLAPPPATERREAPRYACGPLYATMNRQAAATVVNISRSGALLRATSAWAVGTTLTIWVELADRVVEFQGEVVRLSYGRGGAVELGVRFARTGGMASSRWMD